MTLQEALFYLFAALAVLSGSLVITLQHPVKAVFSLIVTFISVSGLWMLLEAEYLSILLLLVYVGAVLVLFLFVVMMLDVEETRHKASFTPYLPVAVCVSVWLILGLAVVNGNKYFGLETVQPPVPYAAGFNYLEVLGALLYSQYLYPLEIAGFILLVAMITAITLTFRSSKKKKIDVTAQVRTSKEERLTLVDVDSQSSVFKIKSSGDDHDTLI